MTNRFVFGLLVGLAVGAVGIMWAAGPSVRALAGMSCLYILGGVR
jgi:hypothetical protein